MSTSLRTIKARIEKDQFENFLSLEPISSRPNIEALFFTIYHSHLSYYLLFSSRPFSDTHEITQTISQLSTPSCNPKEPLPDEEDLLIIPQNPFLDKSSVSDKQFKQDLSDILETKIQSFLKTKSFQMLEIAQTSHSKRLIQRLFLTSQIESNINTTISQEITESLFLDYHLTSPRIFLQKKTDRLRTSQIIYPDQSKLTLLFDNVSKNKIVTYAKEDFSHRIIQTATDEITEFSNCRTKLIPEEDIQALIRSIPTDTFASLPKKTLQKKVTTIIDTQKRSMKRITNIPGRNASIFQTELFQGPSDQTYEYTTLLSNPIILDPRESIRFEQQIKTYFCTERLPEVHHILPNIPYILELEIDLREAL